MSTLQERIVYVPDAPRPWGTSSTPTEMPLAAITHRPAAAHSELYYEALQPVITADGAIIPTQSGMDPPNVIPAGRP